MKKLLLQITMILTATLIALALVACSSDASVVSDNLSKEADQFKIQRRIVFFNGITDTYLLSIDGRCSIEDEGHQLEVTCKVADKQYKKHFLGLSDNVSYFVEQTETANVSAYHYKVIFKPEAIIPDVDLKTSGSDSDG